MYIWRISENAFKCGYALAVHGSLENDLDLIATWESNDNYESPPYY